jgi:hypothetical protein
MAAGLERAVQRRAASRRASFLQRDDLGVRLPCLPVVARADDDTFLGDQDSTDEGIGARSPAPALGEPERPPHELAIGGSVYHFSSKSAST